MLLANSFREVFANGPDKGSLALWFLSGDESDVSDCMGNRMDSIYLNSIKRNYFVLGALFTGLTFLVT